MDEVKKFSELKTAISTLSDKKIRLEERFNREKTNLEKLLKEISEKGYDPKKLSETRKQKEEELKTLMTKLQENIQETQTKLDAIEGD